jgi:hypothetical protein
MVFVSVLAFVDIRRGSETFGRWIGAYLKRGMVIEAYILLHESGESARPKKVN